jgi:hypothetical protein
VHDVRIGGIHAEAETAYDAGRGGTDKASFESQEYTVFPVHPVFSAMSVHTFSMKEIMPDKVSTGKEQVQAGHIGKKYCGP